jgi:hypothetical protein
MLYWERHEQPCLEPPGVLKRQSFYIILHRGYPRDGEGNGLTKTGQEPSVLCKALEGAHRQSLGWGEHGHRLLTAKATLVRVRHFPGSAGCRLLLYSATTCRLVLVNASMASPHNSPTAPKLSAPNTFAAMAPHISLPRFGVTRRGLNVHRREGSRIPAYPFDKISLTRIICPARLIYLGLFVLSPSAAYCYEGDR